VGSAKTQELPITKQFFAGLILKMTSELHAGDTPGLYRRGSFSRCTVIDAGDRGLRPSFAFSGGAGRLNADF